MNFGDLQADTSYKDLVDFLGSVNEADRIIGNLGQGYDMVSTNMDDLIEQALQESMMKGVDGAIGVNTPALKQNIKQRIVAQNFGGKVMAPKTPGYRYPFWHRQSLDLGGSTATLVYFNSDAGTQLRTNMKENNKFSPCRFFVLDRIGLELDPVMRIGTTVDTAVTAPHAMIAEAMSGYMTISRSDTLIAHVRLESLFKNVQAIAVGANTATFNAVALRGALADENGFYKLDKAVVFSYDKRSDLINVEVKWDANLTDNNPYYLKIILDGLRIDG